MRLPGLGPKSAGAHLAGARDHDARRAAGGRGAQRLRALAGMGAKTEENILRALAAPAAAEEPPRTLLGQALPALLAVVSVLREHPACEQVSIAGSARRRQGDGPRPRHHRDGERPGRADRLLHDASLGRRGRRRRADEGDRRLARRLPLRPARRAARVLREPAPALHRLEGPQRRAARGRRAAQALGLRVRRRRTRRPARRSPRAPRRSCTSGSATTSSRPSCARTRASSRRRGGGELPGARRGRRPSRRPAHAYDLVGRRQEHARGDGARRAGARLRVLRDHRPLALPARRPAGGAGRGDRRAERAAGAVPAPPGRRGEHPGGRRARARRRGARAPRLGGRLAAHELRPQPRPSGCSPRWRTRTSTASAT